MSREVGQAAVQLGAAAYGQTGQWMVHHPNE
jgi:hypothetical protein